MTRLGGAMDNGLGLDFSHELQDLPAMANVQRVMMEMLQLARETLEVPVRIAFGTEKIGPHIIIGAVDFPIPCVQVLGDGRTNQAAAASNNNFFHAVKQKSIKQPRPFESTSFIHAAGRAQLDTRTIKP